MSCSSFLTLFFQLPHHSSSLSNKGLISASCEWLSNMLEFMYLNLPTVASGVLLIEMQDGVRMFFPMISVFLMLIVRQNSSEEVVHEALERPSWVWLAKAVLSAKSHEEDIVGFGFGSESVQVEQLAIVMCMQIDPSRRKLECMRQEEWEENPEVPELAHSRLVWPHLELGRALVSRRRSKRCFSCWCETI